MLTRLWWVGVFATWDDYATHALLALIVALLAGASPQFRSPTPVSAGTGFWSGDYFNNMTLSGSPVTSVDEAPTPSPSTAPSLDSYWPLAPQTGINADQFSARFQRSDTYSAATYRSRSRPMTGCASTWITRSSSTSGSTRLRRRTGTRKR